MPEVRLGGEKECEGVRRGLGLAILPRYLIGADLEAGRLRALLAAPFSKHEDWSLRSVGSQ
jgi:DNA-binding transcriptional LysR family regulator